MSVDIKALEMFIQSQKTDKINLNGLRDGPSNLKEILVKDVVPFNDLLKQESLKLLADDVKFSAHALSRIQSRNINLTPLDKQKIALGMNQLEAKGAKDALMMVKDVALIVSVNNKTVVTVVDNKGSGGDGIFTNIDAAMFV